ncbi:hypothetical protein EAF04_003531 [Stromatinia cepivora]|nr:hypothetical protein EAF04_003531 [Stromatinia cepivora]
MHNPTTDPPMSLQNLLSDTALPAASVHTRPLTPRIIMNETTEMKPTKRSPDSKPTSEDKHQEASHRPPAYTSFSTFGLEEPQGPKSSDIPREENPALASSPPTAMQQIKSALGIEQPQK